MFLSGFSNCFKEIVVYYHACICIIIFAAFSAASRMFVFPTLPMRGHWRFTAPVLFEDKHC